MCKRSLLVIFSWVICLLVSSAASAEKFYIAPGEDEPNCIANINFDRDSIIESRYVVADTAAEWKLVCLDVIGRMKSEGFEAWGPSNSLLDKDRWIVNSLCNPKYMNACSSY